MSYDYQTEKVNLFTDEGQRMFLKVRDNAHRLLKEAGAFRQMEVTRGVTGSGWTMIACVDRLVELGEIVELKRECWTQLKVYTEPRIHNA